MNMNSVNKRVIIFIVIPVTLLIVFVAVIIMFFGNKNTQGVNNNNKPAELEIKSVLASGGVPDKNSKEFTAQGWDLVPNLEVLQQDTSSATGGEIASVKYVKYGDYYYAKVGIYTDTEILYFYYINVDNIWVQAEESEVPKEVLEKIK